MMCLLLRPPNDCTPSREAAPPQLRGLFPYGSMPASGHFRTTFPAAAMSAFHDKADIFRAMGLRIEIDC